MKTFSVQWWAMWGLCVAGGIWGFVEIVSDLPFDGAVTMLLAIVLLESTVNKAIKS